RPVPPGRERVDAPGDQLLAGAGFARDEDGGVYGRDLDLALEHLAHGLGLADNAGDLLESAAVEEAPRDERDLLDVDRLEEDLGKAHAADGVRGRGDRLVGEADHGEVIELVRLAEEAPRALLLEPAGEHEEPRVVDVRDALGGREQLDAHALTLERGAQADGRVEIV